MQNRHLSHNRNQGMVLVLSLSFLLLISIISLVGFRASMIDLRVAGNAAAKAMIFEDVESARLQAEASVTEISDDLSAGTIDYDCTNLGAGFFAAAGTGENCTVLDADTLDWDAGDSIASTRPNARYALEYLGVDAAYEINSDVEVGSNDSGQYEVHVFRILGRGKATDGASSTVESLYMARKS